MQFKTVIHTLAVSLFALVAGAEEAHKFIFELRIPKTVKTDPMTSLELTTEADSSGTRLHFTKQREEGEFQIFQDSFLLFPNRRRAFIADVQLQRSQVFVLSIPRKPKPTDWSQWQRPDYIAKGGAGWDFMHDQNKRARSTNVAPDCFQLRYKIEKWKEP